MTTGEDPLPLLLDRAAQGVASFIALLLLLLCQSKEEEIAILFRIHCPCLFSLKAFLFIFKLLDSFYLSVYIFGSRGSQVSIQM